MNKTYATYVHSLHTDRLTCFKILDMTQLSHDFRRSPYLCFTVKPTIYTSEPLLRIHFITINSKLASTKKEIFQIIYLF